MLLSAVLFFSDLGLVLINYVSARQTLRNTLHDRAASLREGFDIALYTTELKLIEIATFVSQIDEVRRDVREGGTAVRQEGGGAGGAESDRWRQALMDVVGPRWSQLQFLYLLRQFSFYLPDNTAFLRVHVPYEYGDRIDRPDFLVAAAAARHEPQSGFDIDRLSVGIRAAVPLIAEATNGDAGANLGVVEVGSSLDTMLVPICPTSRCGTSILLFQDQVKSRMASEAIDAYYTADRRIGPFFIEAASNPAMTRALVNSQQPPRLDIGEPPLMEILGHWVTVTYFPFHDQATKNDPARPAIGIVAIWQDMDDIVREFHRHQLTSLGFAVLAFGLMDILLYRLIHLVTVRLEDEVSRQTNAVQKLLVEVSALAERDHLTDLFNRRAFFDRLSAEAARARRNGAPFSLLALDLDHFKQINDTYGHPIGDEVLRQLARAIRDTIRADDVPGRVGGEEFTILLPSTNAAQAGDLAERLRHRVKEICIRTERGELVHASFSAGVVQWHPNLDLQTHLRLVDRALYRAKAEGRDRVMIVAATEITEAILGEAALGVR
ncbi:MAG: diguanylate cyclase [Azospirillaceae bacterium]|nr:diguanylate cyclase [Azospirillaceae bacterium]